MVLSWVLSSRHQTAMDVCQTLDDDVADMATRLHLQLHKIASQYSRESIESILPLIGRAFDQLNNSVCIAHAQSKKLKTLNKELIDLEEKFEREIKLRKEADLHKLAIEDSLEEMRLNNEELSLEILRYKEDIKSRDLMIYALKAELEDSDVQIKQLKSNSCKTENTSTVAYKTEMKSAYEMYKFINEQRSLPLNNQLNSLKQADGKRGDIVSCPEILPFVGRKTGRVVGQTYAGKVPRLRSRKTMGPRRKIVGDMTDGHSGSRQPLLSETLSDDCEISIVVKPKDDGRLKVAVKSCRQVVSVTAGSSKLYDSFVYPPSSPETSEPVTKMLRQVLDGQDRLMHRMSDVEAKIERTVTTVQVRARPFRPAWWPFVDMSPQTFLFLLVMPLVAHATLLWLSGTQAANIPGIYFSGSLMGNTSRPAIQCTFDV